VSTSYSADTVERLLDSRARVHPDTARGYGVFKNGVDKKFMLNASRQAAVFVQMPYIEGA
jgi:hypothetical protein